MSHRHVQRVNVPSTDKATTCVETVFHVHSKVKFWEIFWRNFPSQGCFPTATGLQQCPVAAIQSTLVSVWPFRALAWRALDRAVSIGMLQRGTDEQLHSQPASSRQQMMALRRNEGPIRALSLATGRMPRLTTKLRSWKSTIIGFQVGYGMQSERSLQMFLRAKSLIE